MLLELKDCYFQIIRLRMKESIETCVVIVSKAFADTDETNIVRPLGLPKGFENKVGYEKFFYKSPFNGIEDTKNNLREMGVSEKFMLYSADLY